VSASFIRDASRHSKQHFPAAPLRSVADVYARHNVITAITFSKYAIARM
jgi:hypothetical protein